MVEGKKIISKEITSMVLYNASIYFLVFGARFNISVFLFDLEPILSKKEEHFLQVELNP